MNDSDKQQKNKAGQLPQNWKPGQSGNPSGRPKKGQALADIARAVLDENLPNSTVTRKEAFIRQVVQLAYEGNETMIKLVWNYIDGLPTARIQLSDERIESELDNLREIMTAQRDQKKQDYEQVLSPLQDQQSDD